MTWQAAVSLAVAGHLVAGCSTKQGEDACTERFSTVGKDISATAKPRIADFVFETEKPKASMVHSMDRVSLTAVMGDGKSAIASFKERDFSERPTVLMANDKTFVGVRRKIKDVDDASRQGCALQDRYGTLRNMRLVFAPSNLTKNEQ